MIIFDFLCGSTCAIRICLFISNWIEKKTLLTVFFRFVLSLSLTIVIPLHMHAYVWVFVCLFVCLHSTKPLLFCSHLFFFKPWWWKCCCSVESALHFYLNLFFLNSLSTSPLSRFLFSKHSAFKEKLNVSCEKLKQQQHRSALTRLDHHQYRQSFKIANNNLNGDTNQAQCISFSSWIYSI